MTEFGQSPLLTFDELADSGYAAVLYPVTMMRMAMQASKRRWQFWQMKARRKACST